MQQGEERMAVSEGELVCVRKSTHLFWGRVESLYLHLLPKAIDEAIDTCL